MVFPQGAPILGYGKLLEEELSSSKQAPTGKQGIIFSEQAMSRSSCESSSSSQPAKSQEESRSSRIKASIKSYLRGDIQRHHGMYVLEEAVTGKAGAARASSTASSRAGSVHSGMSTRIPQMRAVTHF